MLIIDKLLFYTRFIIKPSELVSNLLSVMDELADCDKSIPLYSKSVKCKHPPIFPHRVGDWRICMKGAYNRSSQSITFEDISPDDFDDSCDSDIHDVQPTEISEAESHDAQPDICIGDDTQISTLSDIFDDLPEGLHGVKAYKSYDDISECSSYYDDIHSMESPICEIIKSAKDDENSEYFIKYYVVYFPEKYCTYKLHILSLLHPYNVLTTLDAFKQTPGVIQCNTGKNISIVIRQLRSH